MRIALRTLSLLLAIISSTLPAIFVVLFAEAAQTNTAYPLCDYGSLQVLSEADSCRGVKGHGLWISSRRHNDKNLWKGISTWHKSAFIEYDDEEGSAVILGIVENNDRLWNLRLQLSGREYDVSKVNPFLQNQGTACEA